MRPTYLITHSNIMYKSQWMTVYEDPVSKEDGGTTGMFNRIEVPIRAVIVLPILEDSSLLLVENYRHGADTNLLELPELSMKTKWAPMQLGEKYLKKLGIHVTKLS